VRNRDSNSKYHAHRKQNLVLIPQGMGKADDADLGQGAYVGEAKKGEQAGRRCQILVVRKEEAEEQERKKQSKGKIYFSLVAYTNGGLPQKSPSWANQSNSENGEDGSDSLGTERATAWDNLRMTENA